MYKGLYTSEISPPPTQYYICPCIFNRHSTSFLVAALAYNYGLCLLVEIPHFLTASECQQLRDSASQSGLEDSVFEAGPLRDSGIEEDPSKEEREERFDDLDANKDGKISLWEVSFWHYRH